LKVEYELLKHEADTICIAFLADNSLASIDREGKLVIWAPESHNKFEFASETVLTGKDKTCRIKATSKG